MSNTNAAYIQRQLNKHGYNLNVDGIIGSQTQAAIKDFQQKNGLAVDGVVGPQTWETLTKVKTPSFKYDDFKYDDFKYDAYTPKEYTESDTVKQAQDALNAQLAQKPGEYNSQWQAQLDDTIKKILNREKFSYDLNGDALYQQYKDKYTQQAKMAMGDAIGQASAMTGGYGNSYAQSVGQQQYQAQMENLNDIVPELYQMALDKYNQEGQDLYNQYGMLGAQEEQDYGRYRDSVSDYLTERDYLANRYDSEREYDYSKYIDERNFDYGKYTDDRNFAYGQYADDRNFAYGKYSDDRSLAYNEHRNAIEDDKWLAEYDENVRQYNDSMEWDQKKYNDQKAASNTSNSPQETNTDKKQQTNTQQEPKEEKPTYASISSDLDSFIAGGADRSKIASYIRSALSAGYITQNHAQKLMSPYTPRGYTY